MQEVLSQERIRKIIRENTMFDSPYTADYILKQKDWLIFVGGDGIYLRDTEGREYIDGMSSAMCCSLGHGNRRVIEAIKEQLDKLQFARRAQSDVHLLLCEKIAKVAPPGLNHVYISVTGSDIVEASLTFARQYFRSQGKPNHIIISQWFSYHGVSRGAAGATGLYSYKLNRGRDISDIDSGFYYVFPPYCYRCSYGLEYPQCGIQCAKTIDDVIRYLGPQNVAAFIGELAYGMGGGITPPPEYWPIVKEICSKHKILLIDDEVVTGWGRLGKLWAAEFFNITPDIMVTAKGLTGAYLPLAAMVMHDDVCEPFSGEDAQIPALAHTHSAYPLGCAAALAAIDVTMEERLWENAAKVGLHLKGRLEDIEHKSKVVGAIHGVGLQLGLEIVEDKQSKAPSTNLADAIRRKCNEKGLIIRRIGGWGNLLEIYPPLIITKEQSDKLCDIVSESVQEVEAERK